MPALKLFLLGPPRVELNDQPVELQRRKALALLTYLAVTGRPHSRDALATLFWPDYSQSKARAYLRRDLAVLNTSLTGDWLVADRDTVELRQEADFWLDVAEFRRLLAEGQGHDPPPDTVRPDHLAHLTEAVHLYTGDFLAGFSLRDSAEFDDWQFFQAESLRQELATALEQLVQNCLSQGEAKPAIPHARRWVGLDPLHEPAQRALIQLYDQAGQPSAALRQYEEFVKLLEEELGLPPEEETTTLYEAIKAKRMLGSYLKSTEKASQGERDRPTKSSRRSAKADKPARSESLPPGHETEDVSLPPARATAAPSVAPLPVNVATIPFHYCTTPDNVRLAYAIAGSGPPLVKAANWLSHLEYDWQSPVWRHWLEGLAQHHTLIRYDERGCGLSDWEVSDFSLDAWVRDLETVVEAAGLERFPLLGISQGGPIAIAYALRHPERVSHLILYGTLFRGRLKRELTLQQIEEVQTFLQLIKVGWGQENPAFRQVFTSMFMPGATVEQQRWFNELQRVSTSPENAMRIANSFNTIDATPLAPQVTTPTLVLHATGDVEIPFSEGQLVASLIPGARFVPLESKNHILLEHEPAWSQFLAEVHRFLGVEEVVSEKHFSVSSAPALSSPSLPNLPSQPTTFIGRETEIAEISQLLRDEPTCRLLTLLGPGGIGKTRLALQVATEVVSAFPQGVYFVPLAPLTSAENLVSAVAEHVNFPFHGGADLKQQLLDYLSHKQLLLVMDNFEHVLAGTTLVTEIMQIAPGVKILVTSRERLNLSGEAVLSLAGLEIPDPNNTKDTLEFDAAKLLLHQARLVRPNFELQNEERAEIKRICHLTQGMPLALVLAASWLQVLPLREIAAEIAQSLDFLETEMQDVPARQRSVRAVFDYSWKNLSAQEQQIFMKLSVFRGGFTRPAAQAVAGAGLRVLRGLVNKSLVSFSQKDRYELHELLRQYAADKLKEIGHEETATRQRHSAYYLDFLKSRQPAISSKGQQLALEEIDAEVENIRLAWQWAMQEGPLEALDQASETLYHYCQLRNRYFEGEEILANTIAQWQQSAQPAEPPGFAALFGKILARQGALRFLLGDYETASSQLEQSLTIARRLDQCQEEAFALNILGQVAGWRGEAPLAREFLDQSLAISRKLDDKDGAADVIERLAQINLHLGEYDRGKALAEESLAISQQLERTDRIAKALDTMGFATFCLGQYEESERYYQESLAMFEAIGDQNGVALAWGGLGLVAANRGEAAAAETLAYIEQGLAACREIGHQLHIASRLTVLGWIANSICEYSRAEQYSQESLAITRKLGSLIFTGYNLCNLGSATAEIGNFQASRRYLIEALALLLKAQLRSQLLEALLNYANLLTKESQLLPDNDPERLQKKEMVLEYLRIIIAHANTRHDIKDRARSLLAQLEPELPAEVVETDAARHKSRPLERVVAEILEGEQSSEAKSPLPAGPIRPP